MLFKNTHLSKVSNVLPGKNILIIVLLLTCIFRQTDLLGQKETISDKSQIWVKTTTTNLTIDWNTPMTYPEVSAEIKITDNLNKSLLWSGQVPGKKVGEVYCFTLENLTPRQWTPATPNLYHLEITISDKKQRLLSNNYRIGFRNFESKDGKLYLNGHPIFLRGIAINPPGRGIPQEVETSRKFAEDYVTFMKGMNVNIIRIPDDQTWYDVCDELGMMVFGGNYSGVVNDESPPKDYDSGVEWYKKTKFSPIMHHPSLMIYALTNEVPFAGSNAPKWDKFLTYAHSKLKEWDPTRLYIGNAGYGYGKGGDINDLHRYWGWYYATAYTFLHIRDYDSITFPKISQPLTFTECVGNYTGPDGRYNLTPNHKNPVSQQNWTGHASEDEQPYLADQYQSHVFKTVTELIRRLRRINTESSGVFPFTIMFRNWHTIKTFMEMDPKPVTHQARLSYQPVLISWENWQNQVYAGSAIHPTAHIINDADDFSDIPKGKLVIRLLDKAYTVWYRDTIMLPGIKYFDIYSKKLSITLPSSLMTGDYTLEGILYSQGKEISRNNTALFIARHGFAGTKVQKEILLYDPVGQSEKAFAINGIKYNRISNFKNISTNNCLVIGENCANRFVDDSAASVVEFVKNGGRLVVLRQEATYQQYLKKIMPYGVSFPTMDVDNPSYPPPPRPSRNSFNINPERITHPVFSGIDRAKLRIWSDYNNWDETQKGFPAIYPVTNGFVLENKLDIANTAVLANYSVGLEGVALAEFFSGKGSVLLAGFDLVNRAGVDPVADRIMVNLVKYMANPSGHNNHLLVDEPIIWGKYETEKGLLTGINSGLMLNSKPALFGSYEDLPLILQKDGHLFAEKGGGWNNAAGKQYVPYGRRMFGPYKHRDFGGVPLPLDSKNPIGEGFFWCRIPEGTTVMETIIWNPSDKPLKFTVMVNEKIVSEESITAGKYIEVSSKIAIGLDDIKVTFRGDRRLVLLETRFE